MLPSSTPASLDSPRHVLLTGATGFVGQALLERLLSTTDARISVLIRGRGAVSAPQRLSRLLDKPVFAAWRRRVGDSVARREIAHRIHLLLGDLADLPALPEDVDLVLHSASCVSFDEPIDRALASNVVGAAALYRALHKAGATPHVVHVSTAYVSTGRSAVAAEASLTHDLSWEREVSFAEGAASDTAQRVETGEFTQADATAHLRKLGRDRAGELGWTDVYTLSKALGERVAEELWEQRGNRLTVLRPTIIESAIAAPFPGWIDGYKVADPLMATYARGELNDFPGDPDSIFDIVPVDVVVSMALASAALPPAPHEPRYLHVGTSTSNPLRLSHLREIVQNYFEADPWVTRTGEVVEPARWEFSDPERFHTSLRRKRLALTTLESVLSGLPKNVAERMRSRVGSGLRKLQTLTRFVELFEPYTTIRTTFDDTNARALAAAIEQLEEGSALDGFSIDVTELTWERYLNEVHLPTLVQLMKGRRLAPPMAAVGGQGLTARPHRDHAARRALHARAFPVAMIDSVDIAGRHTA